MFQLRDRDRDRSENDGESAESEDRDAGRRKKVVGMDVLIARNIMVWVSVAISIALIYFGITALL